ncbi:CHAT domain-containing protein [Streptomyces sp. NPDC048269]|uniref:CHAT domain-containing protein n=1 Tax=Streptomyces sp. NPDC048269 TaxID=3155753 RepID=UPI00342F0F87
MERHISVHIDQTDSDTIRLHYDYGSGDQATPVAVDATAVQRRIDRAETEYYAELPSDPEDRDRHLRSLVAFGRDLYAFLDTPQRLLSRCSEDSARDWDILVLGISAGPSSARFSHLPWELLHDGDTFVATAPTPIVPVRRLTGAWPSRPPQHRPLRMVFMACAPDLDTAAPLDYDGEQGRIWEKTRRQRIDLEVEELGDLDELEERIYRRAAGEFDAVHLTGHALHTEDGPKFLTEDPMGRPRQTGIRDLQRSLAGRSTVVFLSGCRTGESADAGAVASLAEKLAQATAPVVLGWGRPVADVMATEAAAVFYQWLARGESPTTALACTYQDMYTRVPYWHLLRMFVRGNPPGPLVVPAADRPVGPVPRDAIVMAEPRPGKAEPAYPDPLRFVGRRRQIQRAIRVLHPFTDARAVRPGLVVQGMGGIGKTTPGGQGLPAPGGPVRLGCPAAARELSDGGVPSASAHGRPPVLGHAGGHRSRLATDAVARRGVSPLPGQPPLLAGRVRDELPARSHDGRRNRHGGRAAHRPERDGPGPGGADRRPRHAPAQRPDRHHQPLSAEPPVYRSLRDHYPHAAA